MGTQTVVKSRYELTGILGEGGMGIVYRAYDTSTKRYVALKTLRDAADPRALDLFTKEWTVLAGLSHPNIVDILDCGEFKESGAPRPYFVMPLLPGKTLDELIRASSQRLTVERTIEILVQSCRGLQAAHERGLVHRDLKPSNIFVMDDDTVKIIDFGVVHLTGSRSITTIKGTLQYMAPEQLELKTTALSDIFALGVVGYEALTGQKPFARPTEGETAQAVKSYFPPPVFEMSPEVNDSIGRVIHKAMAKQPWHRFASARELAESLQKAVRNQPIEAFSPARIQPRVERAKKAVAEGDLQFAQEILSELEAEGNIDPEMAELRRQIDRGARDRNIRQLLESARIRLEGEEYPLALQKVQEVLEIDPENLQALRFKKDIEGRRSEHQLANWLQQARQDVVRGALSAARQSLDEATRLNPSDSRLQQIKAELSRQEEENAVARAGKERLYEAAKEAFQSGEINSALGNMERVVELARKSPDRIAPERDAAYQGFYNQVRSESDAIRAAYAETRRELAQRNFPKALALCDEYLAKYPEHALFQSLRLEITEQERQQLLAYGAAIGRRLDAEPDLDRKLNIIREAISRYPNEPQFQQALKLLQERRELVRSIVAKADQYEQRARWVEAVGQWEILASIYPQYPGLSYKLEQAKRRRETQNQDTSKVRYIAQIDRALAGGDFERALGIVLQALTEYPNDAELKDRERSANEGVDRRRESLRLSEEGRQQFAVGNFAAATELLRKAWTLNGGSEEIRVGLVAALVAWAQALKDNKPGDAEALVGEALRLDANHAGALALRSSLLGAKTKREQPPASLTDSLPRPTYEPVPQAAASVPAKPMRIPAGLQHLSNPRVAGLLAIAILLLAGVVATYIRRGETTKPPPPPPGQYSVDIKTNAPGAVIKIDGNVTGLPARLIEGAHGIEISAPGYQVETHSFGVQAGMAPLVYNLQPEPLRFLITGLNAGTVTLDGQDAGELQEGRFVKDDIAIGDHKLVITNANKSVLELEFKALPAALPVITAPIKGQDLVITAGFADKGHLYAAPGLKSGLKEQPMLPVPDQGVEFPVGEAETELDVSNGNAAKTINLQPLNYPHLSIYANVFGPSQPILVISSNVENPRILIDGTIENLQPFKGKYYKKLNPGKYAVKLSSQGYLDSEQIIEIAKNDNLKRLEFKLEPAPVFASLLIEGGTPGAQMVVGAKPIGTLDGSGNLIADKMPPGDYEIRLSKDLFEPRSLGIRKFEAGQTVRINDAKLTPFGTLVFDVEPQEAQVSYRRDGESDYHDVKSKDEIKARQGRYFVKASAPGRNSIVDRPFTVMSGLSTRVTMELPVIVTITPPPPTLFKNPFEIPASWTKDDDSGTWAYQGNGYGFLRPGLSSVTLSFHKRKGILRGEFGWEVVPGGSGRGIEYFLKQNGSLGRKKGEEETRVSFEGDLVLSINVEPGAITIRDPKGMVDRYAPPNADFSKSKIGVKKGVHVLVGAAP